MVKNKVKSKAKSKSNVRSSEMDDCCDFSDCGESPSDVSIDFGFNKLIEADNFLSSLAFELTQLIIENASVEYRTAEHIVNTFTLSSRIVRENSALSSMMEK